MVANTNRSGVRQILGAVALLGLRACISYAQVANPQQSLPVGTEEQQHIQSLIESLPPGSVLRRVMETGSRGDGIHHPWMDRMRQERVKRALVETEFVWRGKPTEVKISYITYFSAYDRNCDEISNREAISRIRNSGLEDELSNVAVQRTLGAHWHFFERGHPTKHGICIIELFDDEWIPPLPVTLGPAPKKPHPFAEAAAIGDVAQARRLLHAGDISPEERDEALWTNLAGDNSCLTNALLEGGADPNAKDKLGRTLLMTAVLSGAINNTKALLAAGADIKAKDQMGETALSIAERTKNQQIIQLLKAASARE